MSKLGYVYSFNIRNHKNEDDLNPLGVDILTDYECEESGDYAPISQYIKRYIDLDSEEIKMEVIDNPYFSKADIISYSWGSNGGEGDWENIDKEHGAEIIRKYCHDVKYKNIYFEATGEGVAYFHRN